MWWIKAYLKRHRKAVLLYFVFTCIFCGVFYLYRLPVEAVAYASGLCLFVGFLFGLVDSMKYRKRLWNLKQQRMAVKNRIEQLPEPADLTEESYQELLGLVQDEKESQVSALMQEKMELTDYFTLWAHQIKTPIAAMRLLFQQETETTEQWYERKREAEGELFKIEQYVEMVLQYLRLNSSVNDFVLKEYDMDDMVRQAVRKYAPLFIGKKLALHYEPLETQVVTDEKWMVFIIEQILSNAVKYTSQGSVSIYMEETRLVIEDTGIGILPEDLPRIFDKGYTGYNGRGDKKATGIGLYLCRQILNKLGHKIGVESKPGEGTRVWLMF